jgi:hypothetical protein
MKTEKDFEKTKKEGEKFYKTISEVYCPYFCEKVSFDARGLEHLKFKRRGKSRPDEDQYMRIKLIHLAPEILKLSHTLQGKLETTKFENIKTNNRWEHTMRKVTYFEFIAMIKRERCKIIIKQVESDKLFFWSIIPFWGMNQDTMTRIFHHGVPEED